MEAWVPITIAAAFFQNLRSALQKHLKARLSTSGATFSRFGYAFPLAVAYVAGLHGLADLPLPAPNLAFAVYCVVGGMTQIAATALLVYLFSLRNFAVGVTYSKTETVQTAVFGIVLLGEPLHAGATLAIVVTLLGVMLISAVKGQVSVRRVLVTWTDRATLIGLASGAAFGVSAVAYRGAALALGGEGFVMQAAFTLACVTVLQTAVMTAYLRVREPGQLTAVLASWRVSSLVGLCGVLGSAGWFTAMTIQNAAYVKALGQVELVFTFIASTVFFRERVRRLEVAGIGLIVTGILFLVLL